MATPLGEAIIVSLCHAGLISSVWGGRVRNTGSGKAVTIEGEESTAVVDGEAVSLVKQTYQNLSALHPNFIKVSPCFHSDV